ncbi:MAG: hypothetical protein RL885_02045 [Planctomycetota bacterium]
MRIWIAAALLLTLSPWAIANENEEKETQQFSLEKAAPANALVVAGIKDIRSMVDGLEQSAIASMLREDEVRQFLAPAFANFDRWVGEARRELEFEMDGNLSRIIDPDVLQRLMDPREWTTTLDGLGGEVMFVLSDIRESQNGGDSIPDLLFGVDLGRWGPDVRQFVDQKLPELRRMIEEEAQRSGATTNDLPSFGTKEIAGFTVHTIEHDELGDIGGALHYAFIGDYFLFGLFPDTFEKALRRGSQAVGSLLDNDRYRVMSNRLDRRPGSLFAYVDVQRILDMTKKYRSEREDREISGMGFDGVRAVGLTVSPSDGGARTRLFVHAPAPRRGVLALLSQPSRVLDGPKLAPSGATFLVSLGIDPKAVFDQVMSMVRTIDGEEEYREAMQDIDEVEQELGFHPINDLLASIGNEVSVFGTLPKTGLIPDVALVAKLQDPARFQSILDGLVKKAESEAPDVSITEVEYRGAMIYSVSGDEWDLPVPIAFTVHEGRLMISLGVQSLKKIMNGSGQGSLADDATFREAAAKVGYSAGEPATILHYLDAKSLFEWGYNTAAPMLGSQVPPELGFDMALLPMTETLSRHIRNPLSLYRVSDEGMMIDVFSIF